jgi:carbamoyltransferase
MTQPTAPSQPTYILGVNAYDHDVSACLLKDGKIVCAILKERITRIKNDSGFFDGILDYCLQSEGITMNELSLVVRNCYALPTPELEKRLQFHFHSYFIPTAEREKVLAHPFYGTNSPKLASVSHHLAHAYSAFAVCPFEEGAVMVVDGVGSYRQDITEEIPADDVNPLARESESYYTFSGSSIQAIKKVWINPAKGLLHDEFFSMDGLGALYSRVSCYIFQDWNKCGEVMGLAPYGRPDVIEPLIVYEDGVLKFREWTTEFNQPWLEPDPPSKLTWENSPSLQHWRDIAWRIQKDTENVLVERAKWLRATTGAKNLVIAGGVALNCVANGRIVREAGFDNVWIQPAAGDDGIAIGTAYYGHLKLQNKPRTYVQDNAFFGKHYTTQDVQQAIKNHSFFVRSQQSDDTCAQTAAVLAQGKVVGWYQGRCEFGPRALGNRSIIADPRKPEMKDILNKVVKHRQEFRPFAPIVLAERAHEIFEGEEESPYMLLTKFVRPEWRDKIPAVVHADFTARVQTVREDQNPRLYRLLKEFDALTGVPVLINTSFNVKGEPIVETPDDAMRCFLFTGIDRLVLEDYAVDKKSTYKLIGLVVSSFAFAKLAYQNRVK